MGGTLHRYAIADQFITDYTAISYRLVHASEENTNFIQTPTKCSILSLWKKTVQSKIFEVEGRRIQQKLSVCNQQRRT